MWSADIRATLERAGTPIGNNDLFIAAHARSRGMTLVTGNLREFERVPGVCVENWLMEPHWTTTTPTSASARAASIRAAAESSAASTLSLLALPSAICTNLGR